MRRLDWVDARDLESHAMRARYGWLRALSMTEIDSDIKIYCRQIADTILYNIGEEQDWICRMMFLRKFPY